MEQSHINKTRTTKEVLGNKEFLYNIRNVIRQRLLIMSSLLLSIIGNSSCITLEKTPDKSNIALTQEGLIKKTKKFSAYEHLGYEGKAFLEQNIGKTSMPSHLNSIDLKIEEGLKKGWITDEELEKYKELIAGVKNASDANQLEGIILSEVMDGNDKNHFYKILQTNDEIKTLKNYMVLLSNILNFQIRTYKTTTYFCDDNYGVSIVYFNSSNNEVGSGYSKNKFLHLLLSAGDEDLLQYFSKLFSLPTPEEKDIEAAQIQTMELDNNRKIIETLKEFPVLPSKGKPKLKGKKVIPVLQGNSNGHFVTKKDTNFIGTAGMGPCVSLVIYQNGKAFLIHIDDFLGNYSLGVKSAEAIINKYLGNFNQDNTLKIYIIGNSNGIGGRNLLNVYKYLERKRLTQYIRATNFYNHGISDSVVLNVTNGNIYPGANPFDK